MMGDHFPLKICLHFADFNPGADLTVYYNCQAD